MKTCACEICGVLISAERSSPQLVHPSISQETIDAANNLAEFDLLAGRMTVHISEVHPSYAREMSAVGYLAAKVYAMMWTTSSAKDFAALRKIWRKTFLAEIGKERNHAAAPAVSSTPPPEDPDGSYEKNSERNFSI